MVKVPYNFRHDRIYEPHLLTARLDWLPSRTEHHNSLKPRSYESSPASQFDNPLSNTIKKSNIGRTQTYSQPNSIPECTKLSHQFILPSYCNTYAFRTALLNPCNSTCACAAAITAAAFGSLNPHPVFPFCRLAASALHTPSPVAATWLQQAEEQSASDTQPPVMNCAPLPAPTFLAPALLGVTCAAAMAAT